MRDAPRDRAMSLPRLGHVAALDGIRGVAVGIVVLHHLKVPGVHAGDPGTPVAFSRAKPTSACCREGCTWMDSGFAAARTLNRKGSPPKRWATSRPRMVSPAPASSRSSGVVCPATSTVDGPDG